MGRQRDDVECLNGSGLDWHLESERSDQVNIRRMEQ